MTGQFFKPSTLFVAISTILISVSTAHAQNTVEDTLAVSSQESISTSTEASSSVPVTFFPTIVVTAESEVADGPVEGLAASTVSSTTGTDESILKSVQSVTVVGQQEIETVGAEDIYQALGYSAGLNAVNPTDKTTIDYRIRGFRNLGSYRDGQKYQANRFVGSQELYGLERIEVVKGPNSVLNGTMPPGGVVNAISKKPYFTNGHEVNTELGSFDHHKVSTDINRVINEDVAVRLVGVYQDSDSFVEYVPDNRTYIAPSLTWMPSKDTKLTLQADYQNIDTMFVFGMPLEGTLKDSKHGKIPIDRFQGIPEFDEYDNERYSIGYDISHQLKPNLEISHDLRRMTNETNFPITYLWGAVDSDNRLYNRKSYKRLDEGEVITGSLKAKYDWLLNDNIENVTLLGVNYTDTEYSSARSNATASVIDIFTPDHSQDEILTEFSPTATWVNKQKQVGIYLQNQATYNDRLVATVGLRHDTLDSSFEYLEEAQKGFSDKPQDYNETTGRIGFTYIMDNGIAPYASYSQSFEAELGQTRNGSPFVPIEGEQVEVGIRYQPEGSDTLLTGSIYRVDQDNVLVTDPSDANYLIQVGSVRSQGVELEAKTALGDNANLIAAYAYTDARTTEASPLYPEQKGQPVEEVPYNAFSIWGDYRFANMGMPNLKIGAGLRYTGETVDRDYKRVVPDYTLVDAMASYDWSDNLKFSLNVKNLFDEESKICTYFCNYGEPRNIVGKVTYKW